MTAAFLVNGSLMPFGGPVLKVVTTKNSMSSTIGDATQLTTGAAGTGGFMTPGTSTGLIYGHVISHLTGLGVGVLTTGLSGATIGSYVGTYATSSTNVTAAVPDKTQVDISKFSLWTNPTSGTLGTTTGSNVDGYYFNLSDQHTLDETSATTSIAQYQSFGVDPTNALNVIVNISKSWIFN